MLPHEAGNTQCIEVLSSNSQDNSIVRLGGASGPKFTFDEVFPLSTSQLDVFEHSVAPLVTSCLEGYNATILAYGQTGSGKTHTIMGPSGSITTSLQNERQAGVIPRAIRSIFDQLELLRDQNNGETGPENEEEGQRQSYEFDVRVQFLEVYGEEIRDLLSTQQPSPKLSIRDVGMDEPEVVGATEHIVASPEEALLCLTRGMYRRVTGSTAMNETSSRSHAFLSLIVEQSTEVSDEAHCNSDKAMQHVQAKRSKFNFVDLAGAERQKRTQATGQRLKEGIDINKGLLVLGNVISALGDLSKKGKTFVPYRDSKLTRLLKGSLGGNHKTLMMACVSPSSNNMEETLNCLRYANRAKNIQNHAVVNMDATSRLVSELRGKMQMLATDLLKARGGKPSECTIPIEVVESLANGGDGEDIPSKESRGDNNELSPSPLQSRPRQRLSVEGEALQRTDTSRVEEELQKVKAENEVLRLKLQALSKGDDPSEALQQAFMARAAAYEREIAMLRAQSSPLASSQNSSLSQPRFDKTISHQDRPNLPPRTPGRSRQDPTKIRERSMSPELSRLRAQVFGSMSQSNNLDNEVEAEEKAVAALTSKYLGKKADDDDDDDSHENDDSHHQVDEETAENIAARLEADLYELTNSIGAKEELIQKLLVSQEKYEVCILLLTFFGFL
jgi:kinesin family protein 4/21/27